MEQNSLRSSVLSGFFWKFCERFLNQGITFITSLVLARLLAPEDYGVVAIVMVFIHLASVFINSGFAAALIQDAGLKGYQVGGAAISTKHSGFAVNMGGATAEDVKNLLAQVSDIVFEKTGIRLEPEVRIW